MLLITRFIALFMLRRGFVIASCIDNTVLIVAIIDPLFNGSAGADPVYFGAYFFFILAASFLSCSTLRSIAAITNACSCGDSSRKTCGAQRNL
jgi:hypothetical protein